MNILNTTIQVMVELIVARQEAWGEGRVREFGMDWYTLLYLNWVTNGHLLCFTGNFAHRSVAVRTGEDSGGE